MSDFLIVATLTLAGAFAGALAGLLGVGGGIVLVPVFLFVFTQAGYASDDLMQICLATSLATIIVTSARSVMAHQRRGVVDWSILRDFAPGIAIGAVAGVFMVAQLRSTTLQVIFAIMVFVIASYMLFGHRNWRLADAMPHGWPLWVMALATGFVSVLLGIGGGSIGVPIMTLHGRPIHHAVATAAGFGVLIAIPSVAAFLLTPARHAPPLTVGSVNLAAFAIVIVTTTLTAPLGAALAHRINAHRLKLVFAAFLMLVALNMLRKAFMTGL